MLQPEHGGGEMGVPADTSQNKELRILVVDDNVDAATSFAYLLQTLGCKTAVAFGGVTGVRIAELFQPHMVVVDLDMPGMDGCEVLTFLRAKGKATQPYFVCLTGRSEPEDRQRCIDAGFDLFMSKPMEPDELLTALAACRDRQDSTASNAARLSDLQGQPEVGAGDESATGS